MRLCGSPDAIAFQAPSAPLPVFQRILGRTASRALAYR